MPQIIEKWLLFNYVDGQITPQSKPFKTKEQAEWARLKLPERERKSVAVGVIRIKKYDERGWLFLRRSGDEEFYRSGPKLT